MANEKRLIDANVVLAKKFTTGLSDASGNYYGYADVVFADDIENAPTVDAVEVVRGRWERRKSCHSQTGFVDRCSICQSDLVHLGHKTNYCPNCGAKMDGDENA